MVSRARLGSPRFGVFFAMQTALSPLLPTWVKLASCGGTANTVRTTPTGSTSRRLSARSSALLVSMTTYEHCYSPSR
ncbi:hypothetical protein BC939DRAFT_454063 [Gamsiella multidivaricata]|uniref:uncharacterized protein n=1 Tax=Gamsiella multidivaricata TaxID=101098 RepID=UPI002220F469|nr:uncharacterized protein BC939DRAFT_470336 [Gamsiella multidivaricata]XP_051411485.1 uncharacterized protein BC939DRAFT_454063 [Gamsiella multidivaricata]KAI7816113.1 hypothetical protein BC939DRAFT_470336 [Gamsiella multidivaricata]KAI7822413.1 hypothetical protein BC939DRAFT_454063 [Gamsiella multidivaricata]